MDCSTSRLWALWAIVGLGITLVVESSSAVPVELYLRAGVITNTMPDGREVVMWGFARDSAAGVSDGVITVPGPNIILNPDVDSLLIHLTNNLPEPVSLVIAGESMVGDPSRDMDGRARSFTHEALPGGTADYVWSSLQPGTHLYYSGSHSAVQVQMGLYGALVHDSSFGSAYPNVAFNSEAILLFSEIDPELHDAVAADDYGAGKRMTSTVNYAPKYFLINGQCYTNGLALLHVGRPGDTILLRFLNAGLKTHVPIINDTYLRLVAEDGFACPYPKDQYSVFLAAGKTMDAVFQVGMSNTMALYDRSLNLANGTHAPGGMLVYIDIKKNESPTEPPAWWLQQYYGAGPYPPNLMPAYIAGLDPTNPTSALKVASIAFQPGATEFGISLAPTTTGRFYNVLSTTNLLAGSWTLIYTNVPGYTDFMYLALPEMAGNSLFFRVNVELP